MLMQHPVKVSSQYCIFHPVKIQLVHITVYFKFTGLTDENVSSIVFNATMFHVAWGFMRFLERKENEKKKNSILAQRAAPLVKTQIFKFWVCVESASLVVDVVGIAPARPGGGDGGGVELAALRDLLRRHDDVPVVERLHLPEIVD